MNPLNLAQWIDEHRPQLKPPVGNAQIWKDREFMVTIVGGPNSRKDYHVDPGEEFFYQIEGDMILRVMENGVPRDMPIRQGEVFLLPPYVPHSPQRVANSIGMVIERVRRHDEEDHFHWYCENCNDLLHDVHFHLTDITTQLVPVFEKFWADESARTCRKCKSVLNPP